MMVFVVQGNMLPSQIHDEMFAATEAPACPDWIFFFAELVPL